MTSSSKLLRSLWIVAFLGVSCDGAEREEASSPVEARPLRPLIYTELPDLTPQAAAVRERRIMRELLHGASTSNGSWGALGESAEQPDLHDAEAFGRALTRALLDQDEALWDHLFISPASYARAVHVDLERARDFVDELQAASLKAWSLFHVSRLSEAPEGGLASLIEFRSMTLGQGRTLQGELAREDEPVAQHWGNVLTLGLRHHEEVIFEVRLPKILRVPGSPQGASSTLALAAALEPSRRLETFITMGMHLKPELLRSQEYPFPLAVGNFWRYRRYPRDEAPGEGEQADPMEVALLGEEEQRLDRGPGETLLEIVSVERYEGIRLVTYRLSYDDQELSSKTGHWLVAARAIYDCARACVRHIEDLPWLLDTLNRDVPLYVFPISGQQSWGSSASGLSAQVARASEQVEVPAGKYNGVYLIELRGERVMRDPFLTISQLRRAFVPGQGVIRQELRGVSASGEPRWIIEELIEARIMP